MSASSVCTSSGVCCVYTFSTPCPRRRTQTSHSAALPQVPHRSCQAARALHTTPSQQGSTGSACSQQQTLSRAASRTGAPAASAWPAWQSGSKTCGLKRGRRCGARRRRARAACAPGPAAHATARALPGAAAARSSVRALRARTAAQTAAPAAGCSAPHSQFSSLVTARARTLHAAKVRRLCVQTAGVQVRQRKHWPHSSSGRTRPRR